MVMVPVNSCEQPSEKRIALFARFALVAFRFELSQRKNFRKAGEMAFSIRYNQVPPAHRAADTQDGSFDDDFIQIEQAHNTVKSGVCWVQEQKNGTNAAGVG